MHGGLQALERFAFVPRRLLLQSVDPAHRVVLHLLPPHLHRHLRLLLAEELPDLVAILPAYMHI